MVVGAELYDRCVLERRDHGDGLSRLLATTPLTGHRRRSPTDTRPAVRSEPPSAATKQAYDVSPARALAS